MKLLHASQVLEWQSVVLCPATFRVADFLHLKRTLPACPIDTKGSFKTSQSDNL